jgi:hypothetical protein
MSASPALESDLPSVRQQAGASEFHEALCRTNSTDVSYCRPKPSPSFATTVVAPLPSG